MVGVFDKIYASIGNENKLLHKLRVYSLLRFIIRLAANAFLPVYFLSSRSLKQFALTPKPEGSQRIIVSLTSFPTRIGRAWLAIETILRQSTKPDRIILWLSADQFPKVEDLPGRLLELRRRGLEIELRSGDIRSHKKYFYTRREFPNDVMITMDDDIFYPPNAIAELIKWHRLFPDSIIARYGLKIGVDGSKLAPYKTWQTFYDQRKPGTEVFFGSGGGTLFPPGALPAKTLEKEIFLQLAPGADDVWLNTLCRVNGKTIFKTRPQTCSILPVMINKDVFLSTNNLHESQNDVQLQNTRNYFVREIGIDPYGTLLS